MMYQTGNSARLRWLFLLWEAEKAAAPLTITNPLRNPSSPQYHLSFDTSYNDLSRFTFHMGIRTVGRNMSYRDLVAGTALVLFF